MKDAGRKPGFPDVLEYEDYRAFLRDHYRAAKGSIRGFSYGTFARKAGVRSRIYLKLVIDHRKNLGADTARRFALAAGLSGDEIEYFTLLVKENQVDDPDLREAARKRRNRLRRQLGMTSLAPRQVDAFAEEWAVPLVLGATRLKGFRADPDWISRRLGGRIPPDAVRRTIRLLKEEGYLEVRDGRLRRADAEGLAARDDAPPFSIRKMHCRVVREGLRTLEEGLQGTKPFAAHLPLRDEEAQSLYHRLASTVIEAHSPSPKGAEGELYAAVVLLFPLSGARRRGAPSGPRPKTR